MKRIVASILILIAANLGFAGYRVYSGAAISHFDKGNSHARLGNTFGIEKTFDGTQASVVLGLRFIIRSTFTTDNTMVFNTSDQGYYFDALFSEGYLETPLLGIFNLYTDNNVKFALSLGPSFALAILDNSKWYHSTHFFFDYNPHFILENEGTYHEADEIGAGSGVFLNAGLLAEYKNLYLELRYSHGMDKLGALSGVVLHDEQFISFEILFGVHIRK